MIQDFVPIALEIRLFLTRDTQLPRILLLSARRVVSTERRQDPRGFGFGFGAEFFDPCGDLLGDCSSPFGNEEDLWTRRVERSDSWI